MGKHWKYGKWKYALTSTVMATKDQLHIKVTPHQRVQKDKWELKNFSFCGDPDTRPARQLSRISQVAELLSCVLHMYEARCHRSSTVSRYGLLIQWPRSCKKIWCVYCKHITAWQVIRLILMHMSHVQLLWDKSATWSPSQRRSNWDSAGADPLRSATSVTASWTLLPWIIFHSTCSRLDLLQQLDILKVTLKL